MPWLYGLLVGVVAGLVAGAIAERLAIPALAQTLAAAVVALLLAFVGTLELSWRLAMRAGSGGLGAVSHGLGEVMLLLAVPAFFALIAALHVALGRAGHVAPWPANHRAIVLACVAGVCGALPAAWMTAVMLRTFGTD